MNIAIACGGTGGHLFPGIAVGEVLTKRGHKVLLLISEKKIDTLAVHDNKDFEISRIPAVGLPRFVSPEVVPFGLKFVSGYFSCRQVYRRFRPDVVLGMGGFTSTAPILAGKSSRLPTYIHESNAIPGKANRLNARLAREVLLGFSECASYFPNRQTRVTGTPIRQTLRLKVDPEQAAKNLRLKPGLQTVAVIGGSQGAHGVNEAVLAGLPRFAHKPVQFVHLTGTEDHSYVFERYQKEGVPAFVAAFHHRMEEVYTVADLMVARSGAASLSELSYYGCPSILIPYPFAADNHQSLNAAIFQRAGAAEVLEGTDVNGERLGELIERLLSEPAKRAEMKRQMLSLAEPNAAEKIADIVEGKTA
jgi:UDP-N-acetylglucosamine--N-acetylmuramyl-(pentapeptide) pyrophosphoryl-undecaprenol N-acetylglucosamine transferase